MRDFSKKTLAALARKGIALVGLTVIPDMSSDMSSDMPFANGSRGYQLNDNGCHRIRTFAEVLEMAR